MRIKKESKEGLTPRIRLEIEILETYSLYKERSVEFFKEYELTPQQYNVLAILYNGGSMSTSDILTWMYEKNAGVSRLVDRLINKGLVSKEADPTDKRLVTIKLTETGTKLFLMSDSDAKASDTFTSNLTDQEVEQLISLLQKLRGF
jgi:DNA-binding MarR family transcriptional regulator